VQAETYGHPDVPAERLPFACEEWERRAREALSPAAFGYLAGGAGAEDTMRANRDAFYRVRLWPRVARDVTERTTAVSVLGTPCPGPFLLAPIGVQGVLHGEGERATARAAAASGVPLILSTVSSVPLEEVARIMGDVPRWFQLYPGRNRDVMVSLVRRAEAAGYRAIVVTLDTAMLGWRETDLANGYLPFVAGEGIANYLTDPAFLGLLPKSPHEDPRGAVTAFFQIFSNTAFAWPEVKFLRDQTRLPVLLKGILHPDDARVALEHGVDGIVVSNHGGRQVDGAVATLDALPRVVDVVRGRVPVLLDGGIRRGADVLKAIALGAPAVLLGRPYGYGLAVAGERGVRRVIRNLLAEIDIELALAGRRSMAEVDRTLVGG
jgi:isopentenyl diphosphate isomerase/L-lactate dehydrogenase-like FMN-dependent dehydrogenase